MDGTEGTTESSATAGRSDAVRPEVNASHAIARGRVTMKASTSAGVASNSLKKGDVLATARYAGIQAAKEASTLLLHATSIVLSGVEIGFSVGDTHVDIEARVDCVGPWGPEAQALSAVTVAALTVYDMCKAADRTMTIGEVELVEISGRPAGVWRRAGLGHENTD